MATINPDHEAAIAAFHRAAERAGSGGDGRYTRAVAFLEPVVRRLLEEPAAAAPAAQPLTPPPGTVSWYCDRCLHDVRAAEVWQLDPRTFKHTTCGGFVTALPF